jgi:DNA-binding GntR family transcriptional regulator
MASATTPGVSDLNAIATAIYDILWGADRDSVPTAVDHAYERIWRQIVTSEHAPGERLSDLDLSTQIGLSRTPVRQALHRLAQNELIVFDPRRGFRVREWSAKDIHELYDVRGVLETLAFRQALPLFDAGDLHAWRSEIIGLRPRLSRQTVAEFLIHDFRFHNYLIDTSGNGRLSRILANLRGQVSIFQIRDTYFESRMERALDEHERVLEALTTGNEAEAAELLAGHIHGSKERVLADMFSTKE